jgi:hypothetical protein
MLYASVELACAFVYWCSTEVHSFAVYLHHNRLATVVADIYKAVEIVLCLSNLATNANIQIHLQMSYTEVALNRRSLNCLNRS